MGERVGPKHFKGYDTAEGATPAIAQAQELLIQANLESAA